MSSSSVVVLAPVVNVGVIGVAAEGDTGRVALRDTVEGILRRVDSSGFFNLSSSTAGVFFSTNVFLSSELRALWRTGVLRPVLVEDLILP